jgi:hypothetical protein
MVNFLDNLAKGFSAAWDALSSEQTPRSPESVRTRPAADGAAASSPEFAERSSPSSTTGLEASGTNFAKNLGGKAMSPQHDPLATDRQPPVGSTPAGPSTDLSTSIVKSYEDGKLLLESGERVYARDLSFDYVPKAGDRVDFLKQTAPGQKQSSRMVRPSGTAFVPQEFYSQTLKKWALFKDKQQAAEEVRKEFSDLQLKFLSEILAVSQEETWDFRDDAPDAPSAYRNLWNYLSNTFLRLYREDRREPTARKILRRDGYAAWHTGLFDEIYRPIYACFKLRANRSDTDLGAYTYQYSCRPGEQPNWRKFEATFGEEHPVAAQYFSGMDDIYFDPGTPFQEEFDVAHLIEDAIKEGRFPPGFLKETLPNFDSSRFTDFATRKEHLEELLERLRTDTDVLRKCAERLKEAIKGAVRRGHGNYRTTVPIYYPRHDTVSLVLPLCLVNHKVVDAGLVIVKGAVGNSSMRYEPKTIFTLPMAYSNARLVAQPISDWLNPKELRAKAS